MLSVYLYSPSFVIFNLKVMVHNISFERGSWLIYSLPQEKKNRRIGIKSRWHDLYLFFCFHDVLKNTEKFSETNPSTVCVSLRLKTWCEKLFASINVLRSYQETITKQNWKLTSLWNNFLPPFRINLNNYINDE